jgi:hypothetical protein
MKRFLWVIFVVVGVFFTACGGGGSNDVVKEDLPYKPSYSQMASLNETNSEIVALSVYKSVLGTNDFERIDFLGRKSSLNKELKSVQKLSLRLLSKRVTTQSCDIGRAIVNEVSDNETYITYKDCSLDGVTLSGKAHLIKYDSENAVLYFDHLDIKGEQERLYVTKAKFTINGDIFKIENMYANYTNSDMRVEFLNYNQTIVTDEYNNKLTISVDGYIKTACSGGFVYVKTKPEIILDEVASYLVGSLEISSKGAVLNVDFDEDGVYFTDVDGVEEFLTYSELDSKLNRLSCR